MLPLPGSFLGAPSSFSASSALPASITVTSAVNLRNLSALRPLLDWELLKVRIYVLFVSISLTPNTCLAHNRCSIGGC